MKKSAVFFEEVSISSSFLLLINYALGHKIFYKNINSRCRNGIFKKVLNTLNANCLSYLGKGGDLYTSHLDIYNSTVSIYYNDHINNNFIYKRLLDVWGDIDSHIVSTVIKSSVFNRSHLAYGISSVPLISILNKYKEIHVYPNTNNGFLLLKKYYERDQNVHISHRYVDILIIIKVCKYIYKKIKAFGSSVFNSTEKNAVNSGINTNISSNLHLERKILYFPHAGLKYGVFFKKNYLFEERKDSVLNKDNICVVTLLGEFDELTKRYLRAYKISNVIYDDLCSGMNKLKVFFKILWSFKQNIIYDLYLNFEIILFYYHVSVSTGKLKNFKKAKFAYIHYDALFPQHVILALKVCGIQSIALQERLIQYPFIPNLYFDHHLVAGSEIATNMAKYGYKASHYYNVGLPRTEYIHKLKTNSLNIIHNKTLKKTVLCFGIFPISDLDVGMYGEDGTSLKSNIEFLELIVWLAEKLVNYFFYVRFKNTSFFENEISPDLKNMLNKENIYIDMKLNEISSYFLIDNADFVIGKSSMIMEEARAAGKPSFYFDSEKYYTNIDHPIKKLKVIATDKYVLKDMIVNASQSNSSKSSVINYDGLYSSSIKPSHKYLRSIIKDIYNNSSSLLVQPPINQTELRC